MDELELLIEAVGKSPKYRNVCPDVVRNVGARELAARSNLRDAVKATKNKLHQAGGAYLDAADYAGWLDAMRSVARSGNAPRRPLTGEYRDALRRVCLEVMKCHSSTRERLPILDQFYARVLAGLPPPQVVLDVACGLNPLAIWWMPFPPGVQYYAYDMYLDLASFLNEFMGIAGVRGQAEACDVSTCPPTRRADLALILKTLPCLEQLDKLAGSRLLEAVQAEHLLVSFPVRSLGGRDKKMLQNYEARFQELLRGKPWAVQRFEFSSELAFLIHK
jgi:16S rRNA (guanine(1405)-N(7))-methyltransferase